MTLKERKTSYYSREYLTLQKSQVTGTRDWIITRNFMLDAKADMNKRHHAALKNLCTIKYSEDLSKLTRRHLSRTSRSTAHPQKLVITQFVIIVCGRESSPDKSNPNKSLYLKGPYWCFHLFLGLIDWWSLPLTYTTILINFKFLQCILQASVVASSLNDKINNRII